MAVPNTLTAASYAADGASLVFSGKSVTDHAVSSMADEDCALWRMARFESPCRQYADPEEQIAASGGMSSDVPQPGAVATPSPQPGAPEPAHVDRTVVQTELAPVSEPATLSVPSTFVPADAVIPVAASPVAEQRVLVFGSFSRRANAAQLAQTHRDLRAQVVTTNVKGKTYFRVVAAAPSASEAEAMRIRLARRGITGAWLLPLEQTAQSNGAAGG